MPYFLREVGYMYRRTYVYYLLDVRVVEANAEGRRGDDGRHGRRPELPV